MEPYATIGDFERTVKGELLIQPNATIENCLGNLRGIYFPDPPSGQEKRYLDEDASRVVAVSCPAEPRTLIPLRIQGLGYTSRVWGLGLTPNSTPQIPKP